MPAYATKRTRKFRPENPAAPTEQAPRAYRPRLLDLPDPPFSVIVAMPTRDYVPAEFMYDLARMVALTCSTFVADGIINWTMHMLQGTAIHSLREELSKLALARGATHILWLDTDHRFPADAFIRLWNHQLPMVGCNYATRKAPSEFVAFKKVGAVPGEPNERLVTGPESKGLEKVDGLGFGFFLMHTEVLRSLDPNEPWFRFDYDKVSARVIGEDVYFCKLAREAGWDIHVDHDLSKEIGHMGSFDFRVDHAYMFQQEGLIDGADQLHGTQDDARSLARA